MHDIKRRIGDLFDEFIFICEQDNNVSDEGNPWYLELYVVYSDLKFIRENAVLLDDLLDDEHFAEAVDGYLEQVSEKSKQLGIPLLHDKALSLREELEIYIGDTYF